PSRYSVPSSCDASGRKPGERRQDSRGPSRPRTALTREHTGRSLAPPDPRTREVAMAAVSWLHRPFALLAMLLLRASTAWAGGREDKPNLVGGEILGRGILVTLNYERFLTNAVGLGAGVMAVASGGETGVIAPFYLSLLTGDENSLYTSAGVTYV